MPVSSAPPDEGDDAPRRTYNFAPTYRGVVYRADVPDWGGGKEKHSDAGKGGEKAGEEGQGGGEEGGEVGEVGEEGGQEKAGEEGQKEIQYKLQTMKWGSYHPSRSFLPVAGRSFHFYRVVPSL